MAGGLGAGAAAVSGFAALTFLSLVARAGPRRRAAGRPDPTRAPRPAAPAKLQAARPARGSTATAGLRKNSHIPALTFLSLVARARGRAAGPPADPTRPGRRDPRHPPSCKLPAQLGGRPQPPASAKTATYPQRPLSRRPPARESSDHWTATAVPGMGPGEGAAARPGRRVPGDGAVPGSCATLPDGRNDRAPLLAITDEIRPKRATQPNRDTSPSPPIGCCAGHDAADAI